MAGPPPASDERIVRDYRRLREGAARIDLSPWARLELTGEDRLDWLQGQATNDVRALRPGGAVSFCLCEPTGGILAVVDAWALADRIVMTVALPCAPAVLDRVERMTIIEDVAARNMTDERVAYSIQGPSASRELAELLTLPSEDAGAAEIGEAEAWVLRSDRAGAGGWDVWLPHDAETARALMEARFETAVPEAVEATRIEAGIPKWGSDVGPRTLPPELGAAFESRHVSYSKGCYTGQEVLMRLHSRGHTNRTWVGLVGEAPMRTGDTVRRQGQAVGAVASAAISPDLGPIAAAVLRNEATAEGEVVRLGEREAVVRPMPLRRRN